MINRIYSNYSISIAELDLGRIEFNFKRLPDETGKLHIDCQLLLYNFLGLLPDVNISNDENDWKQKSFECEEYDEVKMNDIIIQVLSGVILNYSSLDIDVVTRRHIFKGVFSSGSKEVDYLLIYDYTDKPIKRIQTEGLKVLEFDINTHDNDVLDKFISIFY